MHTHTHTHTHTHRYNMYIYTNVHTYIHTYIHTYKEGARAQVGEVPGGERYHLTCAKQTSAAPVMTTCQKKK